MNYACKWGLNRHYGHAVGQKARKGASISSLSPYRLSVCSVRIYDFSDDKGGDK